MKWTAERTIKAGLLVFTGLGILLLLAYYMPAWEREDKLKEGKQNVSGMDQG